MSLNYVQGNTMYQAGSGNIVGATSIVLTNFSDIYGNILTMASFGSKGYITLEPDTTNEEAAVFTGVTANANGTYTLTGVSTALAQTPYTETSGLVRAHSGGTKVVITDTADFWSTFPNKNSQETIPQNWSTIDPVGMQDIATKAYVLSVVNGGAVSVNAVIVAGTAGAIVAAGNALYLNTDGKWYLADATTSSKSVNVVIGFAQGSGTANNPITGGVLLEGVESNQSALVAGTVYYLSNTPGALGTSAGTFSVQVGVGSTTSTKLFVKSSLASLNKALVSTTSVANGVPQANSNGFISSGYLGNLFTADVDQSQTTSNSTQKFGEANATGKQATIAEKFIPAVPHIRGVKLWKIADTGSFTGTVKIALQADTAGSPSGVDLATYTLTNTQWGKLNNAAEFSVNFGTPYTTMAVGSAYWIVITPSTNDNSNHPNLGANSAGGYASGAFKYFNGTDNWVAVATVILYFKTLEGVVSQIIETDTSGYLPTVIRPYSLLDFTKTAISVANSTAETTVYSKELDAGFFGTTTGLKFKFTSTMLSATGAAVSATWNLYFNDNLLATTGTAQVNNGTDSISTVIDNIEFYVVNTSLTTQNTGVVLIRSLNSGTGAISSATTFLGNFIVNFVSQQSYSTASVDLTGPGVLKLTVTNSVNTGTTTTFRGGIIEKIG